MSDEDGLLQAIRPAQEKFRRAIRITAPDFRPYERKFQGTRHLRRFTFLQSEEGEEWDEGSAESDAESPFDTAFSDLKIRKGRLSNKRIYIDEVLKRAQQSVFHSIL